MALEINEARMDKLQYMARLQLSPAHRLKMTKELNVMAAWIRKLQEVNTEGVTPLATLTTESNRLREDVPKEPLSPARVLHNAPGRSSHYFRTLTVKKGE